MKLQKSSLLSCSATSLSAFQPWPWPAMSCSLASGQWCQKIFRRAADQGFAVPPRQVHGFRYWRLAVCGQDRHRCSGACCGYRKRERAGEFVGFSGQFGGAGSDLVRGEAAPFAPRNSHGSSRRERPSRINTALALKARPTSAPSDPRCVRRCRQACHKSQPLEERNKSSAPISRSRLTTSLGALPAASGLLAISTAWPTMTRRIGVGALSACKALVVAPSVVLLLKVQLEGHAFGQLEQFLELRARDL